MIQQIELNDVLANGKDKYNSHNHWPVPDVKPEHYRETLKKTYCGTWIDKFHNNYSVININSKHLKWMVEANDIGCITGKFPSFFEDELELFLKEYESTNSLFALNKKYFVRTESVSLKYGMHEAGPYTSLKQIAESLTTCTEKHNPLNHFKDGLTNSLKLYLIEWKEMNMELEFRMFINNNQITAISQQDIFTENNILTEFKDDVDRTNYITKMLDKLVNYFENVIKKKITEISSYVIDIVLIQNEPYFIETNSFGKEMAAGSSLFHWLLDEDILYGTSGKLYFRYVVDTAL